MKEEWKDIKGYEGLYQVSDQGRVKSLGNGNSNNSKERILKPMRTKSGYFIVSFCKEGKIERVSVHRLVASAFIPNPNNLPIVNHKDENPSNNSANNLEWCTVKYNNNYGSRLKKASEATKKKVHQFTKSGEFIKEYNSLKEACEQCGFSKSLISTCCTGKKEMGYGYIWKYA